MRCTDLHKASKGARHGVPLCYDHLCEQGGSGSRKDSPHPNGMLLKGFDAALSRSRSPALDTPAIEVAAEAGRDEVRVQAKKENGMTSMRSNSVDLSKIMIPSPPRGALDHEDVMGKPVWLKIRLSRDDGSHDWIMCMGELAGYTPGGVRGDRKLEIYVKYLSRTPSSWTRSTWKTWWTPRTLRRQSRPRRSS